MARKSDIFLRKETIDRILIFYKCDAIGLTLDDLAMFCFLKASQF